MQAINDSKPAALAARGPIIHNGATGVNLRTSTYSGDPTTRSIQEDCQAAVGPIESLIPHRSPTRTTVGLPIGIRRNMNLCLGPKTGMEEVTIWKPPEPPKQCAGLSRSDAGPSSVPSLPLKASKNPRPLLSATRGAAQTLCGTEGRRCLSQQVKEQRMLMDKNKD